MPYARLSVTTRSVLRELDEQDRVRSERLSIAQMFYTTDARNERDDSRIIGGPDSELIPPGRGRFVHGE